MSRITRNYRIGSFICSLLNFLAYLGPFAYYFILALSGEAQDGQKFALTATLIVVGIMTIVAVVNKVALRSRIWIILFGLFVCLDSFIEPIIIIGICQILSEIVLEPLQKWFANKASINAEIDKRM